MKSNSILIFWTSIYLVVISQDFLFSQLRNTGFYWSEVTLYNLHWLMFIPVSLIYLKFLDRKHNFEINKWPNLILLVLFAIGLSFIHLFIFSGIFTGLSKILFSPPHEFTQIYIAAFSNDFYITLLIYLAIPLVFPYLLRKPSKTSLTKKGTDHLLIKQNGKTIKLQVNSIIYLKSDRPYTSVIVDGNKYLTNEGLKKLEIKLDPLIFRRVHRSVILNQNQISEVSSRKNGDYDASMSNGDTVRLSRHFRSNWNDLIFSN